MTDNAENDRGQTADKLTTAEAADRLGVRPRTVRRYIDQGKLKTMGKVSGDGAVESWLLDAESVDTLAAHRSGDKERGPDRGPEGLTLSDSGARMLRQIVREELAAGQKALLPSEEERQERADREARIEGLLEGAPDLRDLAEQVGRLETERDTLREDLQSTQEERDRLENELAAARERIEELEAALAKEREKGWWDRLRGR